MTLEDRNKRLIRRMLAAADVGELELVGSCYSPQYRDHGGDEARRRPGLSDRDATLQLFAALWAAFSETRHVIHDLIAEGDRVAVRISAEGVHTGELFGILPTGRRITNEALVIFRIEDGRIVERWSRDREALVEQLRSGASASEDGT